MSSEDLEEFEPGVGIFATPDPIPEQFGRTGWDAAHSARWWIFIIGIIVAAAALLIYAVSSEIITAEGIVSFAKDNWPTFAAPILGLMMGWWSVNRFYEPSARFLLLTDLESNEVRVIRVPEARFRMMRQAGNTFSLHSYGGRQVYLIRGFDEYSGYIDYGWVHEERAEVVAVNLDAYNRWRDDLTRTKVENLQLIANPQVMAAELSRRNLKDHLDRICFALGLSDREEQHNPMDDNNLTAPETDGEETLDE